MAGVIRIIFDSYQEFDKENTDPRTTSFLFMSSVYYPLCIIGLYYYFVQSLGPKLMKDRKPLDLKNAILIYNIFQIISNAAIFIMACYAVFTDDYKFACEPVDKYYQKHTVSVRFSWYFFILKITDLLDTVFFVLRKKQRQVSFLHVYHHIAMVFFMWVGVKYAADGHGAYLGLLNSAVHTVMYSYYLVSNWNPKYITLRMKKTVTQMQMLQFLIPIIQNTLGLFKEDCDFPKVWIIIMLVQAIFMFFMFLDFYIRTYMKKKTQ